VIYSYNKGQRDAVFLIYRQTWRR